MALFFCCIFAAMMLVYVKYNEKVSAEFSANGRPYHTNPCSFLNCVDFLFPKIVGENYGRQGFGLSSATVGLRQALPRTKSLGGRIAGMSERKMTSCSATSLQSLVGGV